MTEKEIANESYKCECNGSTENIIFLPCSGASNCGQIANQVAVNLTQEGLGKMYCLAGIGAHIEGMIETARAASRVVVLDGCKTACAQKLIEHIGLVVTDRVCVTDLGIRKVHEFDIIPENIVQVAQYTKKLLKV